MLKVSNSTVLRLQKLHTYIATKIKHNVMYTKPPQERVKVALRDLEKRRAAKGLKIYEFLSAPTSSW